MRGLTDAAKHQRVNEALCSSPGVVCRIFLEASEKRFWGTLKALLDTLCLLSLPPPPPPPPPVSISLLPHSSRPLSILPIRSFGPTLLLPLSPPPPPPPSQYDHISPSSSSSSSSPPPPPEASLFPERPFSEDDDEDDPDNSEDIIPNIGIIDKAADHRRLRLLEALHIGGETRLSTSRDFTPPDGGTEGEGESDIEGESSETSSAGGGVRGGGRRSDGQ
ncbi:arp2/3 complex-activating protein rickA-like [Macrobrachium nipponense]|uniref:arp2/3 complex-activating protein rickA-like n=1 Tax=Macrobrachium nipponense TaxID=159736 RepID=UPI0030C7AFA9